MIRMLLLGLLLAGPALAQEPGVGEMAPKPDPMAGAKSAPEMMKKDGGKRMGAPDPHRCLTGEFGLGGFDPVSYRSGAPQRGRAEYAAEHEGFRYAFVDAVNLAAFRADPDAYLSRYGGWCAMSLARGSFTCPDYENFQIEDDSLLLFETTVFTNGRTLWNVDRSGNRARAERNYRGRVEP